MTRKEKGKGTKGDAEEDWITVGDIKARSNERPQKVVVDEILPDKDVRVCVSELMPGRSVEELVDLTAWTKDKSTVLTFSDLGGLITAEQHAKLREGRVFLIDKAVSTDVYKQMRQHVKERTLRVLESEGRSKSEFQHAPEKGRG